MGMMPSAVGAMRRVESVGSTPSTLADGLVEALYENGIDTYFGVPGGAIEPLFNALFRARARGRATVVATRSEAGAGFAADGFFRASGRLAVCTGTTGPGVTNLLTAVMNAHADRIPMVVITPQVAQCKQGRGALQDSSTDGYDMVRVLETFSVYSSHVTHPDQLGPKLLRALSSARRAPRGPVHLSVPCDLLAAELPAEGLCLLQCRAKAARSDARSAALDELWSELEQASRPVFYVGDDAGPGAQRLFDLAEAFAGSVITSPAGKRWVAHDMARYRGVLGFSGHTSAISALRKADLVVAFGVTFDELSTNAWTVLPTARTFVIDEHDSFAYRVPLAHPIIFEPSAACAYLTEKLPSGAAVRSPRRRLLARSGKLAGGTSGPVHPADLMRWLSHALPSHIVVHVDTGNSFSWSTRDMVRPNIDTYRVAMGLSTMGWAVGATLGAALATRERTIGIIGDGSMLMSSLELSVAVQEKLPVTYIVLNDSGLGMVRHGQRLAGAPSIAHEIGDVRFDLIGRACGAAGLRIERLPDLESIPPSYLSSDDHGPCVIDVIIDRDAVPPMLDRVLGLQKGVAE